MEARQPQLVEAAAQAGDGVQVPGNCRKPLGPWRGRVMAQGQAGLEPGLVHHPHVQRRWRIPRVAIVISPYQGELERGAAPSPVRTG